MTKDEAIQHFGTQQRLAEALGLTQGTISGWAGVPYVHQVRLERLTGGVLKAEDPDEFVQRAKV